MRIRPASDGDLEALLAIQRRAGRARSARLADDLAAAVRDPDRLLVVADDVDGTVVGWGVTRRFDEPDGIAPAGEYLMGSTVDPARRRRGIGTALITARLAWIGERADAAWCFANATNAASIAVHAAAGFEEAGRAARIHGVRFDGGTGVLMVARGIAGEAAG